MNGTFILKPSPGAKVRDPVTKQHLAESGEQKPRTSYWLRRVSEGVAMVVVQPAAKAAADKGGK